MNLPRPLALWGGIALVLIGAWLLHQAYERAGIARPFWAKLLPV